MKHSKTPWQPPGTGWQLIVATLYLTACGQTKSSELSGRNTYPKETQSEDQAEAPEMTVEDVVQGFQMAGELPDQQFSDADMAQWTASLVSEESLRSADAEIDGPAFYLDETTPDEREVVDLRPHDTAVRNQGSGGTCTAFATVATMENLVKRFYGETVDLSERHHWTTYANYQSTTSLKVATSAPIVSEQTWPYNGRKPGSLSGLGVAKLNSYSTTKLSLKPIVESLRKGQPVVIAVGVLSSLMNPKQGGIVTGGTQRPGAGHAIALTGAIMDSKVPGGGYFIIKNSWGTRWGDKGYGYVAFDYCQRTWCSAYAIADASLYREGAAVPKPVTPNSDEPPTPVPTPSEPASPTVDPAPPAIAASDFKLVGHPSHRRGLFGMTSFYLTIEAKPEIMKRIKSIQYAPSEGSYYTVYNGSAADVPVSISNMASPDFRTRGRSFETDDVVVKLRDGTLFSVPGINVSL